MQHGGDWETKAWGRTRRLIGSELFERHELEVNRGGFCSVHWHAERANRFIVLTGEIHVFAFYGWHVERHELGPDNILDIPSLVPHIFQVISDGRVLEDYWPDRGGRVRSDDIHRLVSGGRIEEGWQAGVSDLYDDAMEAFAEAVGKAGLVGPGRGMGK